MNKREQNCDQDTANTLEHKATEEIQIKASPRQKKSLNKTDFCTLHSQHFVACGNWPPPKQPLLVSIRVKRSKNCCVGGGGKQTCHLKDWSLNQYMSQKFQN